MNEYETPYSPLLNFFKSPNFLVFGWPLISIVFLVITILTSLMIGAVFISPESLFLGEMTNLEKTVLLTIRLPRILLSAIVGGGLAVAGASLQGLFRNPLADPTLIGIASGAALAVAFTIVIILPSLDVNDGVFDLYCLAFAAFIGGMITTLIVFALARSEDQLSIAHILLGGIAMTAIASAGTGIMIYISNDNQLRALTFWTMGSFAGALWPTVIVASSVVIPCSFWLISLSRALNILLLGKDEAEHLGINTQSIYTQVIVASALLIGVCVAVSGIIGFVGLVVPHIIRLALSSDHRTLLPLSVIFGAILLVLADTLARNVILPSEMPVGVITSLIGGPFFLWLLVRKKGGFL